MRISFDFSEKFSEGPSTTYQVKRAQFDKILADTAMGKGVRFFYEHNLDAINFNDGKVHVEATNTNTKTTVNFSSKFILDGSGFGRVLPRLLDLNLPSDFPNRKSIYCHFKDNLNSNEFEREKIIIAVHDHTPQVWFWLIGFNDGTSSLGVVCENKYIDELSGSDLDKLKSLSKGNKQLWELLEKADFNNECRAVIWNSSL